MATWCPVCASEIPHFRRLAGIAPAGEVAFYGLPIDPAETPDALAAYQAEREPGYQVLTALDGPQRESLEALLRDRFGDLPLPATIVTGAAGEVILLKKGTPTVSEIRRLVAPGVPGR
jgi:thiol-disulfide isomerase/thioredoxin